MGSTIELEMDGMAHGGEAMGRYQGKAIFVPYAIPGERVRAEIVEEKERWARARLVEVLRPSPDRVDPPCIYFGPGKCSGCQWQHIRYERQAELKGEILADQLRRLGRIAEPAVRDTVVVAGNDDTGVEDEGYLDYAYRNQTGFGIAPDGRPGYRRAGGSDIIPIEKCLLLHDLLDEMHEALQVSWPGLSAIHLRAGLNTGQQLIALEGEGDEQPELELELPASVALLARRGVQPLIGQPWIEEEVAGRRYRVSARSFFHTNTAAAEALLQVVLQYAQAGPLDTVVDAYCGVGFLTLPLAERAGQVIGIDSSPDALEDLAVNAGDIENVEAHEGAVEEVAPALLNQGQRAAILVLDPPRAGAGPDALSSLLALEPRRVVYVSADPAALARDALHLAAAGYRLVEVQPVDLSPQTFQVQSVGLFTNQ